MNKSKISFYLIFIALFTFIAIFITIVQASYNNLVNPSKQVEADKFLEPLNPVLDSEIIQEIEKHQESKEGDILITNSSNQNTNETISPSPSVISTTPTPIDNTQPISPTNETN